MSHARLTRRGPAARAFGNRAPEGLEPRLVPAVFNVNSLADILGPPAGVVTLRSAIRAANAASGPSAINLTVTGTYRLTLPGTATDGSAGELAITGTAGLTIANTSGGAVSINGGGLNRVLDVDPAATAKPFAVTLRGLTITGGFGDAGGGIRVRGGASLTLDHTSVFGNVASGSGGGISVQTGNTGGLTLVAATVGGNSAQGNGGGIDDAGAGALTIGAGSQVVGNVARADGGGIDVFTARLIASGAVISGNVSVTGNGGGVCNSGSGPAAFAGMLVEGNTAGGVGGGYADVPGLAALAITDSAFLRDSAAAEGGAVFTDGTSTAVKGSTIASDTAALGGGGLELRSSSTPGAPARLTDDLFSGDSSGEGGGIESYGVALTNAGCTFSGDVARIDGGGLRLFSGTATISASLFRGDSAGVDGGGLQHVTGSLTLSGSRLTGDSARFGGGLEGQGDSLSVTSTTFDHDDASLNGGGLDLKPPSTATTTITDSTIALDTSGAAGGGLDFEGASGSRLDLFSDTIDRNTAATAGGGLAIAFDVVEEADTILAGDLAAGVANDLSVNVGTLGDFGGNLVGTTAGTSGHAGPGVLVADPKLGPLLDNGGPSAGSPSDSGVVPTQALLPGSPAFARGVTGSAIPKVDARGFPHASKPALGAYEPQYAANAIPNQVFVENLYEVLLDRPADPAGLSGGAAFLNGGGPATTLIQILQATPEYLDVQVSRLYRRDLDRAPTASEMASIAAGLKAGATPEAVAAVLIGSTVFAADYGGTNDGFVEAAFVAVLGRPTSGVPERVAWDAALTKGANRPSVASVLLASQEYLTDLISDDFAAYLGLSPSSTDLSAFLAAAHAGVPAPRLAAIALAASLPSRA